MLLARKTRHGMNSALLALLALASAAFLQAIVSNHNFSWDLSQGQVHTLSDETVKAAKNLEQEVLIYAFYAAGDGQAGPFEDLLKRVKQENPSKIKYEFVDMNKKPLLAQQYAVRSSGTSVIVTGTRSESISGAKEEDLVNALIKVSSAGSKVVYVLGGHGEKSVQDTQGSGLSELKRGLESSNFTVRELSLDQSPKVPEDCAVLFLAGSRSDYLAPELALFDDYLGRGGRMVVAVDPRVRAPGLIAWLQRAGVIVGEDVIVDFNPVNQLFGGSPIAPIIANFDHEHPVTKDMAGQRVQVIAPISRSLAPAPKLPPGTQATALAKTFDSAWAYRGTANQVPSKPSASDGKGPLAVALALEADAKLFLKKPEEGGNQRARLVVFGTSGILGNQAIAMFNNQDFVVNSVRWLSDETKRISIAPKDEASAPMRLERSSATLIWWSLILLCLGTLGLGVTVTLRRRRAL